MCNQALHCYAKHFCHYCLQSFGTAKVLKKYVHDDCFKINDKQMIKMNKNVKILNSKPLWERQNRHSWFMVVLKVL